jgi:cyclase
MEHRFITRRDIKGPTLTGIQVESLPVLGQPEAFAKYYYEYGTNEFVYMGAVARLYGRNSLLDIVNAD